MRLLRLTFISLFVLSGGLSTIQAKENDLPPGEIIKRFAQKETEFQKLWQQYTYRQRILFQVLGRGNRVEEEREMIIEVYFTKDGQRHTRTLSDEGQLVSVRITKEDMSDAVSMQPFVLTSDVIGQYKIDYQGKERIDELNTFVFDVKPTKIEKKERYFQGRIWVDDVDFQIVMTRGKIVPDYGNNKFPEFETIREQVDGTNWFPTWTEADDVLTFGSFFGGGQNRVHVRQLITYGDYKKFEVGTSIRFGSEEAPENPPKQ